MGNCLGSSIIAPISKNSTNSLGSKSSGNSSTTKGEGNGGGGGPSTHIFGEIVVPNLKAFSYQELIKATSNFKQDTMLGEGGFGRVYKGWIDETTLEPSKPTLGGLPIAVKRSKADSAQGFKEWNMEIKFLGKLSHPNVVKLIGYCCEETELLLVYEFMQKGSLETHLFQQNREAPSWSTRIDIAIDAARGLDFLHTTEEVVIYRDFKAANILLDKNYNAKLSDFGIARLGPIDKSHVTTQAMGTYGYVAPEYINTSHLYVRSDVYSFGVVLLELITGQRAFDSNRPSGQANLADWCRPMLNQNSKLKKIIDVRLKEYPPKAVNEMAQLIWKCIQIDYKKRPHMCEVLLILEGIKSIQVSPKGVNGFIKSNSDGRDVRVSRRGGNGGVSPRQASLP
ncbi:putative serine/threonine-protein kinase CST [Silene latifolia]|uniref:putative serine/threonine-protein kinase CST n=1 Tax=Silene latifolia TaxID=37657 RepID=UPI003D784F35